MECSRNLPRKPFWLFGCGMAGVSLLCGLWEILRRSMDAGGGLGALDTHATFTTVSLALRIVPAIAFPFFVFGLRYIALRTCRGERAAPEDLLEGLRYFSPMLMAAAFLLGQYLIAVCIADSISAVLFVYTPYGASWAQELLGGENFLVLQLPGEALAVYGGIYLALFLVFAAPVFYRCRMVDYAIMDGASGLPALMLSHAVTRCHRLALFRQDLRLWWLWAGFGVTVAAANASAFSELSPWLAAGLSILAAGGQLLLCIAPLPKAVLAEAERYEQLRNSPAPQPNTPVKHPWERWQ